MICSTASAGARMRFRAGDSSVHSIASGVTRTSSPLLQQIAFRSWIAAVLPSTSALIDAASSALTGRWTARVVEQAARAKAINQSFIERVTIDGGERPQLNSAIKSQLPVSSLEAGGAGRPSAPVSLPPPEAP